jgi:hypothetical protein
VAVVAVGAFLKIIDANKKSQTLKTAINNVNFALESISREMRVGSNYTCYPSIQEGTQVLAAPSIDGLTSQHACDDGVVVYFNSSHRSTSGQCNLIYAYWFDVNEAEQINSIKKAEQGDCGEAITEADFVPIISQDAVIDERLLKVTVNTSSTGPQPKVFIHIRGHAGVKEKNKTYFDVQTTVSQRNAI